MPTLKTVLVQTINGGRLRINEADFDPKKHKLFNQKNKPANFAETPEPKPDPEPDTEPDEVDALREQLSKLAGKQLTTRKDIYDHVLERFGISLGSRLSLKELLVEAVRLHEDENLE